MLNNGGSSLTYDGIHWTGAGNRIVANSVLAAIDRTRYAVNVNGTIKSDYSVSRMDSTNLLIADTARVLKATANLLKVYATANTDTLIDVRIASYGVHSGDENVYMRLAGAQLGAAGSFPQDTFKWTYRFLNEWRMWRNNQIIEEMGQGGIYHKYTSNGYFEWNPGTYWKLNNVGYINNPNNTGTVELRLYGPGVNLNDYHGMRFAGRDGGGGTDSFDVHFIVGGDGGGRKDTLALFHNSAYVWRSYRVGTQKIFGVQARIVHDGIPTYANDAAADADTNLPSKGEYLKTGDRTLYIKP
jgi:hypothetical protein